MDWQQLAQQLFGTDHAVAAEGSFLRGTARFDGQDLEVIGTTDHAFVGYELALRQAAAVLDVVREHPGRPLLLLVDTQGQQLRRRDELLGINRAMAHLACCVDLARRSGHPVVALVYDQALSGGFLSTGLMADDCYAVPGAEIRVMRLPAMARITKIAEERLQALSRANPVFAPGVDNYVAMGAVRAVWEGDLAECLRAALRDRSARDARAEAGLARGGRLRAADIIRQVLAEP